MKFKKQIAALALVSASLSVPMAQANAADKLELYDQYLNIQAAIADVDNMDNGVAAVIAYGHVIPEVSKKFALEAEVTTTVVDPERPGTEMSYSTLGAYAVYAPPISESVALRGRAGLIYQDISVTGQGKSDNDFEVSFGFGATTELANDLHLIFEYTVMDSDISHISAGIQLRM